MDTNDRFTNADTKSPDDVNSLSHSIDIMKAAFPYLDSQTQQTLNLAIKTGELLESFQTVKQEGKVTALSIRKQSIDIEALLTSIRTVCTQQEKDFIDIILNIFKAKNLYNTYSTLVSAMASQSESSDNTDNAEHENNVGSMFGMEGNPNMMEILETFLSPEQKSTFDNLNMMFSVMQ